MVVAAGETVRGKGHVIKGRDHVIKVYVQVTNIHPASGRPGKGGGGGGSAFCQI